MAVVYYKKRGGEEVSVRLLRGQRKRKHVALDKYEKIQSLG